MKTESRLHVRRAAAGDSRAPAALSGCAAVVLALNPSIDAEWRVAAVQWEEKNSLRSERRWAGGKGVNVARWLKHLGEKPRLLLPLGGVTGVELAKNLRAEKIPARIIRLREATRVNVIVTTDGGRQMRFNPPGPGLSREEWSEVLKTVERSLRQHGSPQGRARHSVRAGVGSGWGAHGVTRPTGLLILSGSLPRGVPVSAYAQIIRLARRHGLRTLLDCDGATFASAVAARPFLVKPNAHELAQWHGTPLRSEKEIVGAARKLSETTRGWVLVSRGAKRSLLVNSRENFLAFAKPPRVKPRNTVGAGDAMLAAVAKNICGGAEPVDWLKSGVSVGASATQVAAGQLPD